MKNIKEENQIDDEMLVRFFDAKEAGKSFPDALHVLGDAHISDVDLAELHALWNLHGTLVRSAHNTSPDQALLMRTLSELSPGHTPPVTQPVSPSYNQESAQGAVSSINNKLIFFMNTNWKIVAPMAVIVIAVIVATQLEQSTPARLAVNESNTTNMATMSADSQMAQPEVASPVSGNVDDLVASLTLEADQDAQLFADAEEDSALVGADSQAITDISTSYDETTF